MDMVFIENEAMGLAAYERAILADRLLQSILPISDVRQKMWEEESEDRLAAYRSGELVAIEGENAMAELQAKYSK